MVIDVARAVASVAVPSADAFPAHLRRPAAVWGSVPRHSHPCASDAVSIDLWAVVSRRPWAAEHLCPVYDSYPAGVPADPNSAGMVGIVSAVRLDSALTYSDIGPGQVAYCFGQLELAHNWLDIAAVHRNYLEMDICISKTVL